MGPLCTLHRCRAVAVAMPHVRFSGPHEVREVNGMQGHLYFELADTAQAQQTAHSPQRPQKKITRTTRPDAIRASRSELGQSMPAGTVRRLNL